MLSLHHVARLLPLGTYVFLAACGVKKLRVIVKKVAYMKPVAIRSASCHFDGTEFFVAFDRCRKMSFTVLSRGGLFGTGIVPFWVEVSEL